jgi:hypothetical protein
MEVIIKLTTASGPGAIIFEFEDIDDFLGRTISVDIPDRLVRERYEHLVDGNPEGFVKIGGSSMPNDASEHYDVINSILRFMLLNDNFQDFSYDPPEVDPEVPGGDVWRIQ